MVWYLQSFELKMQLSAGFQAPTPGIRRVIALALPILAYPGHIRLAWCSTVSLLPT